MNVLRMWGGGMGIISVYDTVRQNMKHFSGQGLPRNHFVPFFKLSRVVPHSADMLKLSLVEVGDQLLRDLEAWLEHRNETLHLDLLVLLPCLPLREHLGRIDRL